MDIFILLFIGLILFWLGKKVIEIYQKIFPNLPKWHDKRGDDYKEWKINN